MPRQSKYVVPDEEINSIKQGKTTVSEVASRLTVPYQVVYNKVTKGKLKEEFEFDKGDTNPTPTDQLPKESGSLEPTQPTPVDYTDITHNFWSTVSMALTIALPIFTRGNFSFDSLNEVELNDLTSSTKEVIGKWLFDLKGMNGVLALGFAVYKLKDKIHKVEKPKPEPKDVKKPEPTEQKNETQNTETNSDTAKVGL